MKSYGGIFAKSINTPEYVFVFEVGALLIISHSSYPTIRFPTNYKGGELDGLHLALVNYNTESNAVLIVLHDNHLPMVLQCNPWEFKPLIPQWESQK